MPTERRDLRETPPPKRHPEIRDAFKSLDGGEALRVANDHEPEPLFYEFQAEVAAHGFQTAVTAAADRSIVSYSYPRSASFG